MGITCIGVDWISGAGVAVVPCPHPGFLDRRISEEIDPCQTRDINRCSFGFYKRKNSVGRIIVKNNPCNQIYVSFVKKKREKQVTYNVKMLVWFFDFPSRFNKHEL